MNKLPQQLLRCLAALTCHFTSQQKATKTHSLVRSRLVSTVESLRDWHRPEGQDLGKQIMIGQYKAKNALQLKKGKKISSEEARAKRFARELEKKDKQRVKPGFLFLYKNTQIERSRCHHQEKI